MSRDQFAGTRIMVVGGAGFVGSNLVHELLRHRPESILIVDNFLSAERANVPDAPAVKLIRASITENRLLRSLKDDLDYVFHLATFHGNQNSIHDPLADHANNTLTTLKLFLRLSGFRNLKKVVYASAGCTVAEKTYGRAKATTEDAPVSLWHDSPYQISKIVGELYANYFFMKHALPVVKARFQNVYGPGEILGAGKWRGTSATVWRNVVPVFVYKALKGEALPVEGKGESTRDFIYVQDLVRGLLRCAAAGHPGEVYNLASGVETSILRLVELVNGITGNTAPVEYRPSRPWDRSGKRFGSTAKAAQELKFQARIDLAKGLGLTVRWTRSNLELIDRCVCRHAGRLSP